MVVYPLCLVFYSLIAILIPQPHSVSKNLSDQQQASLKTLETMSCFTKDDEDNVTRDEQEKETD